MRSIDDPIISQMRVGILNRAIGQAIGIGFIHNTYRYVCVH